MVYLRKLILNRIPRTYLIIIVTNLAYLPIYTLTTSSQLTILNIIASIFYLSFTSHFIQLYSWIYFLADLIIYYAIFAIIFLFVEICKKIKNKPKIGAIIQCAIILLLYTIISLIVGKPLNQRAIFCFALGSLLGAFEFHFINFAIRYRLYIASVLFVITVILCIVMKSYFIKEQIIPIISSIMLITLFANMALQSKILVYLGTISFYIYLVHGAFYKLLKYYTSLSSITNFVIIMISSIIISTIMYQIQLLWQRHKNNTKTFI